MDGMQAELVIFGDVLVVKGINLGCHSVPEGPW